MACFRCEVDGFGQMNLLQFRRQSFLPRLEERVAFGNLPRVTVGGFGQLLRFIEHKQRVGRKKFHQRRGFVGRALQKAEFSRRRDDDVSGVCRAIVA